MHEGRLVLTAGPSARPLLALGAVLTLAVLTLAAHARLVPVAPARAQNTPTITLTVSPSSEREGDGSESVDGESRIRSLTIKATLDGGARSTATRVSLSISDGGTATGGNSADGRDGSDYKALVPDSVTIPPNETSASIWLNLRIHDDTAVESDETIVIGGAADGFTVNPATVTIVDNDHPSTSATLSVSPALIVESATATEVKVTARLDDGVLTAATSVSLQLGGTATTPGDYTYTPATLAISIAEGSLSGTVKITISAVPDGIDDHRESISVTGSVDGDSSFGVTGATIELLDFPRPAAVTDLRASVVSDSEIRLEWTRPSGPIDGYRLERRRGYYDGINWHEMPAPGPAATSYVDGGLEPTRYRYRLYALNDSGESPASNVAEVILVGEAPPPGGSPGPAPPPGGGGSGPSEPEPEPGLSFEDVDASSALAEGIARAVELGIFTETAPGRFSPEQTMSRVDTAAPLVGLWQALGHSCSQEASLPFEDVAGSEARADVACLYALGVTNGTTATTFSPDRSVTRAQIASLFIRLWHRAGFECPADGELVFDDVADGSVHRDDIVCLHALGITKGTTETMFAPERLLTRAEVAAFAVRLYDLAESS